MLLADTMHLLGQKRELFLATARGKTPTPPPSNLPAELTPFIGRSRELREIRALLTSSQLVTLTGAGGAGKTRLSLHVAAGLLSGSADGVWLAELAAVTDANSIPTAIADALRIPPQPNRSALDSLVNAITPQAMLIVLDNCEHLIDSCAKTADVLLRR